MSQAAVVSVVGFPCPGVVKLALHPDVLGVPLDEVNFTPTLLTLVATALTVQVEILASPQFFCPIRFSFWIQ